ncbi:MAG: Ig-like domain-containing protein, partial [Candidatus Thiodiazotropha sp.]
MATADVDIDIRVSGTINSNSDYVSYIASIENCSDLSSLQVSAGNFQDTFAPSETTRLQDTAAGCRLDFNGTGAGRYSPQVTLTFRDGASQVHTESFYSEDNSPQLAFTGVSFQLIDEQQYLIVQADASDDVDVSYVEFSVVGLRASELRSAGGVVDDAKASAFADSNGGELVYPVRDAQGTYTLSLPVTSSLDANAIAHDGVVLVDLLAVDSSGNQQSASKIAFTGDDVVEQAEAMQVSPKSIIFTNLLETVSIIPSVQFQFRGLTQLAGPGSGVSYTSSHPDLIAVTSGGLVYPLGETNGQQVSITVSYPGLDPVEIPVEVDSSKSIVGLQVDEVDAGGRFVLQRLNTPIALPKVFALFNDGSRTEIASQFPLNYTLDPAAEGILELIENEELMAHAIIPSTIPISLAIALQHQTDITLDLPVIAQDALPEISMELPSRLEAGSNLELSADASDDVAVRKVQFYMDDAIIGELDESPYAINLTLTDQMINSTLSFKAIAFDSAGQTQETLPQKVTVTSEPEAELPAVEFEKPEDLQRFTEGTPFLMQVAVPLDEEELLASNIAYVNFFMDGVRVGEANFPIIEERTELDEKGKEKTVYYELWRLVSALKSIATNETSVSIYADVFAANGASKRVPARLIRVLSNQEPSATIIEPVAGTVASVGQDLDIVVQFSDDTLPAGASVLLLVNGTEIDQYQYEDYEHRYDGSFEIQQAKHRFTIPIVEELLGTTLNIRARVTDYHEEVAFTQTLKIPVKQDQPPSVALSYPTEGARFIAGLPIELRAEATDDVAIARVDFYVNGLLVGSDDTAPYSTVYDTIEDISQEQVLVMSASVIDSKGQRGESAEVSVTLGQDEEAPVVNLVSPEITNTEGGVEYAKVIEDSEVVLKVAGYDNVGVTKVIVKGVRKVGNQFELTGDLDDVLAPEDFAPQQIPGALKAFSAMKLIK